MGGSDGERKLSEKKEEKKCFFPLQVQIANAIANAPVVMGRATAKHEREGGEHRWREGDESGGEQDGWRREEGISGENAVMPDQ